MPQILLSIQGLKTVIESAELLRQTFPEIQFLFVGEGADRKFLHSLVSEKGLSNVHFLPQQPRERIPELIQASDICLVPLRNEPVFRTVIPSKMLEFMAGARPIILGVQGQAQEILEAADAGIPVKPEDSEALAKSIIDLYQNSSQRKVLGRNGRKYVLQHLTRKCTAEAYLEVLKRHIQIVER